MSKAQPASLPVQGADFHTFIAVDPVIVAGGVDDALDMLETRGILEGQRINRMLDGMTQADHLAEIAFVGKSAGRTDFEAGAAFFGTGKPVVHRITGQLGVSNHGRETQAGAIDRMVHLAAAAEGAQAGPDGGMFERQDAPGLKVVKSHRRVAGNHHGGVLSLRFDEIAQLQRDFHSMDK